MPFRARLSWSVRLAGIALLSAFLGACGGGDDGGQPAPVATNALEGVWTGTLTDATGKTYTIENEHVASGTAVKGTARLVGADGTIHHGALTGTQTTAGMDWSADFRGTLGVVDFRGTRNGKSMTLTFAQRGTPAGAGTGTLAFAKAGGVDLHGTYQVDWSANGQTGNFQFTVVTQGGTNTIPMVDMLLLDSYMGFFGSCVGSTISLGTSVFTGASGSAYALVKMSFSAVEAGASGTVSGETQAQGKTTPISGTYKLTKVSS